jgi:DNA-directed RNA polymerase I, II, and III subunit RPABC2
MSDSESLDYDSDDKEKADLPEVDVVSDGDEEPAEADEPDLAGLNLQSDLALGDTGTAQAIFEETTLAGDDVALSDDEMEEDSFQKFDQESKQEYIESFHPEAKQLNYDEILALCTVVRDSNGNVIDELHRTNPWLTKYEYTRVLGQRTKQLNQGVAPNVEVPPNTVDNSIVAKMELDAKRIPFIIRRPMPGGGTEFWRLRDLESLSH